MFRVRWWVADGVEGKVLENIDAGIDVLVVERELVVESPGRE